MQLQQCKTEYLVIYLHTSFALKGMSLCALVRASVKLLVKYALHRAPEV